MTDKIAEVQATITATVVDTPVGAVYTELFGEAPFSEFMLDWVPLGLTVILPVLCLLFFAVGICGKNEPEKPTGNRVVRRVGLAIKADVRMIKTMANSKKYKGPTSLKDVETGKKLSPVKGKSEEAAIKKKAVEQKPGGKGGRFY